MYRGTTPKIEIAFDFDTNLIDVLFVTFVQGKVVMFEKEALHCEMSGNIASITLTQNETLSLKAGVPVSLQCRYKMIDGTVDATDPISIKVEDIYKDGEI